MIPNPSMITNTIRIGIRTAGSARICRALTFSSEDSMAIRRPQPVERITAARVGWKVGSPSGSLATVRSMKAGSKDIPESLPTAPGAAPTPWPSLIPALVWVPEGGLPACPPPGGCSARAPSRALRLPLPAGLSTKAGRLLLDRQNSAGG